jgi:hypothetical protein
MIRVRVGSRDSGEVIDVASVVFFILLTLAIIDVAPSVVRRLAGRRTGEVTGTPPPSAEVEDPWASLAAIQATLLVERVEVTLTARLLAGQLSAQRYRQAMAGIAEQEAVRRRPFVPRERGR